MWKKTYNSYFSYYNIVVYKIRTVIYIGTHLFLWYLKNIGTSQKKSSQPR